MDGTRKYHSELEPKGHAWYVLTNKWTLARKKCTEYPRYSPQNSKVNRLKGPSEDTSIPLGREKKATTRGKEGRELGGKEDGAGERGT